MGLSAEAIIAIIGVAIALPPTIIIITNRIRRRREHNPAVELQSPEPRQQQRADSRRTHIYMLLEEGRLSHSVTISSQPDYPVADLASGFHLKAPSARGMLPR
ncbi:hypothetical protein DL769_007290 [Monosporascus sp. CRB-8-3]|nr:hypothetical protein DL769_007290 [Monosporascus sp. CRB-8-3]